MVREAKFKKSVTVVRCDTTDFEDDSCLTRSPCYQTSHIPVEDIKTRCRKYKEEITTEVLSDFYCEVRAKGEHPCGFPDELKYTTIKTGKYEWVDETQRYCLCPVCGNTIILNSHKKRTPELKKSIWREQ